MKLADKTGLTLINVGKIALKLAEPPVHHQDEHLQLVALKVIHTWRYQVSHGNSAWTTGVSMLFESTMSYTSGVLRYS